MFKRPVLTTGLAIFAAGILVATAAAEEEPYTFIMVGHAPVADPYWVSVQRGFEQAGEDLGVNVQYRGTDKTLNEPNQQRRNIEAAIAAGPDGLIITNPSPDSLNDVIKKATTRRKQATIPTRGRLRPMSFPMR